jgi:hypothetical protein
MTMIAPLTDQQLDEIAGRAAGLYEYATGLDAAWQDEADQLAGTDVPALLAEVHRLRAAAPPADRPTGDHEAVYVDEHGLLYGEYRSSPKTADTHLLRLQWVDEMAVSKADLEAEGATFQLLGWSK